MNQDFDSILAAALSLSDTQRALLIDELAESLPPDTGPYTDEEMVVELDRRFADFEKNPSSAIPWSELKRGSESLKD